MNFGDKKGVSFGFLNEKWIEQFEDEVLLAKLPDGNTFCKRGTPLGVELTDEEVLLLEGAELWHTHTTPIGGTFSSDDIMLTTRTKSPLHIVRATLFDSYYSLRRLDEKSIVPEGNFAVDYRKIEHKHLNDRARMRIWKAEYEKAVN